MKLLKLFFAALPLFFLLFTAGCGGSGGGSSPDPGMLALTTGTVTGTLSNSITAQLMNGITVTVSATNQAATTDATGSFSISNVPFGPQNLIFSQSGGLVGSLAITVGSATDALGPVKVVVIGSSQPGAPPLPTISPNGAIFISSQTVTMADAQSGTRIAYTSDGSDPRVSGTTRTYSGPLTVSGTTTLNAAAEGSPSIFSAVTSATFTLTSGGTGTGGSGTGGSGTGGSGTGGSGTGGSGTGGSGTGGSGTGTGGGTGTGTGGTGSVGGYTGTINFSNGASQSITILVMQATIASTESISLATDCPADQGRTDDLLSEGAIPYNSTITINDKTADGNPFTLTMTLNASGGSGSITAAGGAIDPASGNPLPAYTGTFTLTPTTFFSGSLGAVSRSSAVQPR